jgi:hypothetical protein
MASPPLYLFARAFLESNATGTFSPDDEELLHALAHVQVRGPPSWGAMFWAPLHLWSILKVPMFPTEEERLFLTESLQRAWPSFIPCPQCAHHFAANAKEIFDHTDSGLNLFRRLVDMHNWVNVHMKGALPVSYIEAAKIYSDPEHLCICLKEGMMRKSDASVIDFIVKSLVIATILSAFAFVLVSNIRLRRQLFNLKTQKKTPKDEKMN